MLILQNNIIGTFLKLEQLVTTNGAYTKDDLVIAGIPSPDQVALLINASSLTEDGPGAVKALSSKEETAEPVTVTTTKEETSTEIQNPPETNAAVAEE